RVGGGEEVVHAHRVADLDPVIRHHLLVEEEDVASVDAHRDQVALVVKRDLVDQALRNDVRPALLLPKIGDRYAVIRLDVPSFQLLAGVALPAIRWIAATKAGLEGGLRVGAGTTCNGSVDDLDVWRDGQECVEELLE